MTEILPLPDHLDSHAAPPLAEAILPHKGTDLRADGSAVTFAGALSVQVLVAAAEQWRIDGRRFDLDRASEALLEACTNLGVAPDRIGIGQPQAEGV